MNVVVFIDLLVNINDSWEKLRISRHKVGENKFKPWNKKFILDPNIYKYLVVNTSDYILVT